MSSEIFRFMTIRPPQEVDSKIATKNAVNLNVSTSDFIELLVEKRKFDSRDEMDKLAQKFIKSGSAFVDSRKKVDIRFLSFYESLSGLEEKKFYKNAKDSFIKIFNVEPKKFILGDDFKQLFVGVTNSIVVAAIEQNIESKVRSLLISLVKTLGLIQKLADLQERQNYSKADFHSQIIILPEGIFPLPTIKQDLSKINKAEKEKLKKAAENQEKLLKLSKELTTNRNAINDLLTTFEKSTIQPKQPKSESKKGSALTNKNVALSGFMLSDKDVNSLNSETKAVLRKVGLENSNVDVARATSLIEKQSSEISDKLYANNHSMTYMVKIGNNLVPSDTLTGDMPTVLTDTAIAHRGMCPPVPIRNENNADVTVPLDKTHGEARVLGIADLMLVEQELLRYELGEIAHIENVLKSELREREFRTATTTEQSTLTETEVIDEKTKDLTSAERFELQTEAEKVINENTSTAAGVTVNASYGPSVDVTANFNHTYSNSKQESNRASANFSRDTTTRAASKVQKRTLERRFVRTVSEIEEINKHSFDNKLGKNNISGVYRFVDKIYQAQIINYGKRLMLEFVVPEPAAFLRYAMTKQPIEGVAQIKPEPPGYCINNNFIALQPQNLDRNSYIYWASKYLAEDVTPPPNETFVLSKSIIGTEEETSNKISTKSLTIQIPDDYSPSKAVILREKAELPADPDETNPPKNILIIMIDNKVVMENGEHVFNAGSWREVSVAVLTIRIESYAILVNIFCLLTKEAFQEWQIKTYNSIMNAYNDQKSRYDNAMEAARIRAGYSQISGTNPFMNRECEKTELKKGCISLLTAQNFEAFDSMRRNVAPHGYPEIAFADANAEGRYIQFFENAFEWVNMLYIFYPYFWGKKDDWVTISQISDNDPLYTQFLQAGAARVQVPVRPGFEVSLGHYLQLGTIWYGEGRLITIEDVLAAQSIVNPLYLSVLDELKEQLGNQNIEGIGRLTVKKDDAKVTGVGTEFIKEDDENKRIIIKGKTYLIKEVINTTEIQLIEKFIDADENDVPYSMGAKLVGEPWEVKLPTNLVMIDSDNSTLIVS